MLGLYGKHPAKGDFLDVGLGSLKPALESWLDTVLAETRHGLADTWEAVWDNGHPLRFWIGADIWGEPVAGVMLPSADKVGRRFPLLILGAGADCPPAPVLNAQQDWHAGVETYLLALCAAPDSAPALDGLSPSLPPAVATDPSDGPSDFWAVRPDFDTAGLLEDIAITDHARAAQRRSYWWAAGTAASQSQVWAGDGLPSGHVLAWFLRGHDQNG